MRVRISVVVTVSVLLLASLAGATTQLGSQTACIANDNASATDMPNFIWTTRGVVQGSGSAKTLYCPLVATNSSNGSNMTAASFWVYQNPSTRISGYLGCTDPGSSTSHYSSGAYSGSNNFSQVSIAAADITSLNSVCGSTYPLYMYFVWLESANSASLTQFSWTY